ncbi:hypothetical protein [Nitrosopumilus sp.]|uniref:hypothetical protein n=1 Tax=Nitrosopumilus sp. TaxID=2024843 RepID=UPI002616A769|nr:hypothetical protein [Nitrosopumilus sp.]
MKSKIIFSALLGIALVGISQFGFAEDIENTSHVAVDEEKFEQPDSKYNYQEIVILGYVENYERGQQITISIVSPDASEKEINTYASKKGEIYTLLHITQESQIGIHQVILTYHGVDIASTTFEILENQ